MIAALVIRYFIIVLPHYADSYLCLLQSCFCLWQVDEFLRILGNTTETPQLYAGMMVSADHRNMIRLMDGHVGK